MPAPPYYAPARPYTWALPPAPPALRPIRNLRSGSSTATDVAAGSLDELPQRQRQTADREHGVVVVGHRGCWMGPENTLAAVRLALEAGAPMIAVSVRLSSDRVPMVIHDDALQRTTGEAGFVSATSAALLARVDAGRTKGPHFRGERIPTLESLLAAVKNRARVALELRAEGGEQAIVDVILKSGIAPGSVTIAARDLRQLRKIGALEPRLGRTLVVDALPKLRDPLRALLVQAAAAGVSAVCVLAAASVDAATVKLALDAKVHTYVGPVNDEDEMKRLVTTARVHGVVTDKPALALRVLASLD